MSGSRRPLRRFGRTCLAPDLAIEPRGSGRGAWGSRDQTFVATLRRAMIRRTIHRLTTTFFVALSLLFAQLALANYVCPGRADPAAMAAQMAAGEPCAGMDQAQPVLCHQHAAGAAQSFETVKPPAASLPMIVQVLVVPLVLQAAEAETLPATSTRETRPPAEPLFLATLRLRV
jgi:hypothetical protein